MKVAIKFHDNDFTDVFVGVLEILLNNIRYDDDLQHIDKDHLLFIINELSFSCYLLRCTRSINDYKFSDSNSDSDRLYVNIDKDRLYVNDEVNELIQEIGQNGNHSIIILDTDLDYEGNNPIYLI